MVISKVKEGALLWVDSMLLFALQVILEERDLVFSRRKEAMVKEMRAILKNDTWKLTTLPVVERVVGCKWVLSIKQKSDRSIDR
jgi:hypothetical protein